MELQEVIKTRRSVRKFKDQAIPQDVLDEMLESVRLAPSASNIQPWRILRIAQDYHFYLCRTKGYGLVSYDLQLNDMGIAKCHFDKAAIETGLAGEWIQTDHPSVEDWEYIMTWQGR